MPGGCYSEANFTELINQTTQTFTDLNEERTGVVLKKEASMDAIQAVSVIVGLLALRFGVPLALSLGISYGMNRLVESWEE